MVFFDIVVIGGGAAGFFAALSAKQANTNINVLLLEKSTHLLNKVRISGGGRCNVTHACFDPMQLIRNYPRGGKALIGPFTRFQPQDTINWFESRGVKLKIESDGRMFPVTDNSQTIIDCLLKEAKKLNVEIHTKQSVESIRKHQEKFQIILSNNDIIECANLLLATGSNPQSYSFAKAFGHTIQEPVPSLFTFNVPTFSLKDLAGISVEQATLHIVDSNFSQTGPLLITHWGFSGPAALKLSAWGARWLHEKKYCIQLSVDWLPNLSSEETMSILKALRNEFPKQSIISRNPFQLPKNLWKRLIDFSDINNDKRLTEVSNEEWMRLCKFLKFNIYSVEGKTTHKEEFVTCGGITLNEINFKTMESRLCKGLFFAGEVLDIDAVTGGFNFQNAWTTGWIAGQAMSEF